MSITIVIQPLLGTPTYFGEYDNVGEAIHIAANLKAHFTGQIRVEEKISAVQATVAGTPIFTKIYEIPNNR